MDYTESIRQRWKELAKETLRVQLNSRFRHDLRSSGRYTALEWFLHYSGDGKDLNARRNQEERKGPGGYRE